MAVMRILLAVACVSMLAGCNREAPAAADVPTASTVELASMPDPAIPRSLEPLPASFSGVLPCADCPGIRFDLDLRPQHVFFLRMTYLERERSYDDMGTWSLASDLRTLALRGARQAPLLFTIVDGNTLRKLDVEGQPIESELNYELARTADLQPLSPQVPLRGMYTPRGSGAIIEECLTGMELAVEGEAASRLAQVFATVRKGDDRAMLVALEGRIEAPSDLAKATLMPTSTARFWPSESCGPRGVTHELEGSRWMLVRVGERPFLAQQDRPQPYLVLQASTKQLAGHTGCNRLSGDYRIQDRTLEFGNVVTTHMACPPTRDRARDAHRARASGTLGARRQSIGVA